MPRHTLFAYVEGSDLDDIADALEGRLRAFVEGIGSPVKHGSSTSSWRATQAARSPKTFPCWDLELNLHLPDPGMEPAGWLADVEAIARFFGNLHEEFGRDFVIDIGDAQTGIAEDLYWIADGSPDLKMLAQVIGLHPIH